VAYVDLVHNERGQIAPLKNITTEMVRQVILEIMSPCKQLCNQVSIAVEWNLVVTREDKLRHQNMIMALKWLYIHVDKL